jgi:predicted nucleotidyltransferase
MTKEQEQVLEQVRERFVPKVEEAFGANLRSITLYGSILTDRFNPRYSDVNVLILLAEADPKAVIALGKSGSSLIRKLRITPLLLTEAEFTSSSDVFPMEYLDIVETRRVLVGDDIAARLDITKTNLRHQVEEQLRGSITALRQALLGARGRDPLMARILREWFGAQNALFRGLLRLHGEASIPTTATETITRVGTAWKVETAGLEAAARLRAGERVSAVETAEAVLRAFTALATKIDTLDA